MFRFTVCTALTAANASLLMRPQHFGPEENVSTYTSQVVMKLTADIHDPQRMDPKVMNLSKVPPTAQTSHFRFPLLVLFHLLLLLLLVCVAGLSVVYLLLVFSFCFYFGTRVLSRHKQTCQWFCIGIVWNMYSTPTWNQCRLKKRKKVRKKIFTLREDMGDAQG